MGLRVWWFGRGGVWMKWRVYDGGVEAGRGGPFPDESGWLSQVVPQYFNYTICPAGRPETCWPVDQMYTYPAGHLELTLVLKQTCLR